MFSRNRAIVIVIAGIDVLSDGEKSNAGRSKLLDALYALYQASAPTIELPTSLWRQSVFAAHRSSSDRAAAGTLLLHSSRYRRTHCERPSPAVSNIPLTPATAFRRSDRLC